MKRKMHNGESFLKGISEEVMIAAALRDEADIPMVSPSFARKCMSAASGRHDGVSCGRLFGVAASVALVASLATWSVTVAVMAAMARHRAPEAVAVSAAVEDVSMVGVNTPRHGGAADAQSGDAAAAVLAMSNECVVNTNPGATVLWKALNAGQSQMAWEWPDGARSARLIITGCGMTAEKIYGKDDAFPVWNPPVPEDFNEDDVYTARLVFYRGLKGTGDEMSQLVASGIGFVRGVSGTGRCVAGGIQFTVPAMFGWAMAGR